MTDRKLTFRVSLLRVTSHDNDDFVFDIDPLKINVRDSFRVDSVATENDFVIELPGPAERADVNVLADLEFDLFAVWSRQDEGVFFAELNPGDHRKLLIRIAVDRVRFQTCSSKCFPDIVGRLVETLRADSTPLKFIRREVLDVLQESLFSSSRELSRKSDRRRYKDQRSN